MFVVVVVVVVAGFSWLTDEDIVARPHEVCEKGLGGDPSTLMLAWTFVLGHVFKNGHFGCAKCNFT